MIKIIIKILIFLLLAFVYLVILAINLNTGIFIGILIVVYQGYKLRNLPIKVYEIIFKWIKIVYFKYEKTTSNLLLIQRKLLAVVIISGLLFILFDSIELIRFNLIFNTSVREAVEYSRENFMLPNVPLNTYSIKGREYANYEQNFKRFGLEAKTRWDWYLDEVFLSGITFLTSLFFLFTTIIIKEVTDDIKKEHKSDI